MSRARLRGYFFPPHETLLISKELPQTTFHSTTLVIAGLSLALIAGNMLVLVILGILDIETARRSREMSIVGGRRRARSVTSRTRTTWTDSPP